MKNNVKTDVKEVAQIIKNAKFATAFSGAGISVESGIPPFRGAGGLWEKYDPKFIEIDFFYANPLKSWSEMKKIFFNSMGKAAPNKAHQVLARMEKEGFLKGVITQNIDYLHQRAGSKNVQEFHGTINYLMCTQCAKRYSVDGFDLSAVLPQCSCGGVLKPDFVFYGEGINPQVYSASLQLAAQSDVMLVIGTSGEVMPACSMPLIAKQKTPPATIIEVNTLPSTYTGAVSDFYFEEKAGSFFAALEQELFLAPQTN